MDYFPLLAGLLEVQLLPPLSQLVALWLRLVVSGFPLKGPVWLLGGSTNSLNVTYFAKTQTFGLLESALVWLMSSSSKGYEQYCS